MEKGGNAPQREVTGKVGSKAEDIDWKNTPKDVGNIEIGSENDPGRRAEAEMVARSARTGGGGRGTGKESENPYGALEGKEDEA